MDKYYSVENSRKFAWSSVSGQLNPERLSYLESHILGEQILDAGCGGGAYVEFLTRKGLKVTGLDKHSQFLQLAKNQQYLGTYVQGDITSIPFADKSFDCTYCFDVLEHVNDQLAVQELFRVTRKRLIITVPKEDEIMPRYNLTFLHYQDKTHLRNYTEASLYQLFSVIPSIKIELFTELAVPIKPMLIELVHQPENLSFLSRIKWTIFQNHLRSMIAKVMFKEIFTGLVAIIDLQP